MSVNKKSNSGSIAKKKLSPALSRSLFIITVYILFGLSWILVTDSINFTLLDGITDLALVSVIKGCFYVLITGGLIFALVYPALLKNAANQAQLEKANGELEREKEKLLSSQKLLRESETLLRAVFNQATVGISIGTNEKNVVTDCLDEPAVNAMFLKITGRSIQELRKLTWGDLTYPDDLRDDYRRLEKLKTKEIYDAEKRIILPDGSPLWVHMLISPISLDAVACDLQLCIVEDISERKELEASFNELMRSRTFLLDNLQGMAYSSCWDGTSSMTFVSQGCRQLTGYSQEALMQNWSLFDDLLLPEYRPILKRAWAHALDTQTKLKEEYEIVTADGESKWVLEQGKGIINERGRLVALEGLIIDITQLKEQELRFKYISEHDPVTGIANRLSFNSFLADMLSAGLDGQTHAVILIHIIKMNLMNLTHGFQVSEQLVKEVSVSLSGLCSGNCRLFQVASDRFVYYVTNYDHRDALANLCEKVITIFDNKLSKHYIQIGIVEIDDDQWDADGLMKYAAIAAASNTKNSMYRYFSHEMETLLQRRETIIGELAAEVRSETTGKLFVEYQPIIETTTQRFVGFEALARFNSAIFGCVPPSEFIALAEEEYLIVTLGKKIILMALNFMRNLQEAGYAHTTVSVNLSAIQLLWDGFIPELTEIISTMDVRPENLIVEITESVFADNYIQLNNKIARLNALGIKVAIDDFGTGYSSLARESELKTNCLKIDKYFVDSLDTDNDNDNRTIMADIISMAHKLGHSVVAEGVETERQARYLTVHQCDYMQGYLFGRPMPEDEALKAISKNADLCRNHQN